MFRFFHYRQQGIRLLWFSLVLLVATLGGSQAEQVSAEPLAPVTYDDNAVPPVAYTGAWTFSNSSTNAMSSTLHWSNVVGNKATLSFNGSTISLFYSMAYNRGGHAVYIDGQLKGAYGSYAPEIRRQVGKTWSVSPGNHTIEVVVNGGGFTDVDAFAIDIATVGEGVYDNGHSHIRYFGSWTDSSCTPGTYNNSLKISNTPQSGFRFTFTGDEITYIYSMHSNRGRAAITIDGNDYGYIDQYSPDLRRQIGKTFSGLGPGVHILNVVVSGDKNASSSDYYVDLDALVVGNVYNRTAAVSYADTWAHGRNGNYPNYGNPNDSPCNDCTNYVSQVLEAGGMPQIAHVSYNNDYYWYTYYIFGWSASDTWKVTSPNGPSDTIASFKKHIDTFTWRYQQVSSVNNLVQGDFFLVDTNDNFHNGPDHASVIVGWGIVQEGDQIGQYRLLRNAHCNDRYRVRWDYGFEPSEPKWYYHVIY